MGITVLFLFAFALGTAAPALAGYPAQPEQPNPDRPGRLVRHPPWATSPPAAKRPTTVQRARPAPSAAPKKHKAPRPPKKEEEPRRAPPPRKVGPRRPADVGVRPVSAPSELVTPIVTTAAAAAAVLFAGMIAVGFMRREELA